MVVMMAVMMEGLSVWIWHLDGIVSSCMLASIAKTGCCCCMASASIGATVEPISAWQPLASVLTGVDSVGLELIDVGAEVDYQFKLHVESRFLGAGAGAAGAGAGAGAVAEGRTVPLHLWGG